MFSGLGLDFRASKTGIDPFLQSYKPNFAIFYYIQGAPENFVISVSKV